MSAILLLVFAATQETLQAEALCESAGIEGALVLKPKGMIGNCGLALQVNAATAEGLLSLLAERNIVPAGVFTGVDSGRWEALDSE